MWFLYRVQSQAKPNLHQSALQVHLRFFVQTECGLWPFQWNYVNSTPTTAPFGDTAPLKQPYVMNSLSGFIIIEKTCHAISWWAFDAKFKFITFIKSVLLPLWHKRCTPLCAVFFCSRNTTDCPWNRIVQLWDCSVGKMKPFKVYE